MLNIKSSQLENIERILFDKMVQRIEIAIATTFPDICAEPQTEIDPSAKRAPNAQTKELVERWIEKGVGLGIQDEPDLAVFIALGLAIRSAPPESCGWINTTLTQPETPGSTKIIIIEEELSNKSKNDPVSAEILLRLKTARAGIET